MDKKSISDQELMLIINKYKNEKLNLLLKNSELLGDRLQERVEFSNLSLKDYCESENIVYNNLKVTLRRERKALEQKLGSLLFLLEEGKEDTQEYITRTKILEEKINNYIQVDHKKELNYINEFLGLSLTEVDLVEGSYNLKSIRSNKKLLYRASKNYRELLHSLIDPSAIRTLGILLRKLSEDTLTEKEREILKEIGD